MRAAGADWIADRLAQACDLEASNGIGALTVVADD
jgi:hypothetical protein